MDQCFTTTEMSHFEYKWSIRDFSLHLECAQAEKEKILLKSSVFTTNDGNNTDWCLYIHVHGTETDVKDYIGIYVRCESSVKTTKVFASQSYFLVNAANKRILMKRTPMQKFSANSGYFGCRNVYKKEDLLKDSDKYLPNDTLTIICKFNIMGESKSSVLNNHISKVNSNNLSKDLACLLRNKEFNDVIFIIHKKRIGAHKAILAARSPVFASMFKHRMKGEINTEVNITDLTPEIFANMLHYIYTGEVLELDEMAENLLPAADKYGLKELKQICTESLCKQMTIDNAARILILADRQNVTKLMEHAETFINEYTVDVMETSEYKMMEHQYPHLAAKLFRMIAMKKGRSKRVKTVA